MYSFMSNRYRVKRTCHTKPIVTDCLLPCGPAVWESLTTASTRLSLRHLRARVRNQVSVSSCSMLCTYCYFCNFDQFYEFQSFVFCLFNVFSHFTSHPTYFFLLCMCREASVQSWLPAAAALRSSHMCPSSGLRADPRRDWQHTRYNVGIQEPQHHLRLFYHLHN